jgi:Carboxypeptidase regulatory-like domain
MFMNNRARRLAFGLATLAILSSNIPCLAQSDRGSITGAITDGAGSSIAAASVTATNEGTGAQNHTVTTGAGEYTIPELPAGVYSLTVESQGFTKLIHSGITVSVNLNVRVDMTLNVGAATTTVNVTSDAPLLKTENPENNITVTSTDFNSLPLNMAGVGAVRDPLSFAELAPGTTVGGWNDIHINGSPGNTYRIILDGQDSGSGLHSRVSDEEQPSVEALQEFTLQADSFPPEFGQTTGGIFNYTTKSGANRFHGSLYEYFVNEALNAGQPFTDNGNGGLVRPKSRQNDFGGSFGGPVWIPKIYDGHNRTFFFFNYEMYRDRVATNNGFETVPTAAYRNGDLSYLLTGEQIGTDPLGRPIMNGAIYDPATTRTVNGQVVRDPFPNNYINPNRFDPVAAKVLSYLPTPVNGSPTKNYPDIFPANKFQWIPSIKIDHTLTSNIHLAGYYASQSTDKDNGGDGLPDPISARRYQVIRSHTIRINADDVLTPSLVLHVGGGFQRYHNPDTTPLTTFNQPSSLGLNGALVGGFPVMGGLNINGQSLGFGPSNYGLYVLNKPTAVASISWIKGTHSLKFGGEWRHENWLNESSENALGIYGFDAQQTGLPSTNGANLNGGSVGNGFASFLLGQLNTGTIGNVVNPRWERSTAGIYAQDSWKATHRLTITYGLRYDMQQLQHEQKYRTSQFNPTTANPSAGGLPGGAQFEGNGAGRCNCIFEHYYPWGFGPRFGVTFQADPKTVFHGAVGMFMGQQPSLNYVGSGNSLGFGWNTVNLSAPGFGLSAGQLSAGIPYTHAQLYANNFDPGIRPDPGQLDGLPSWNAPNNGHPPRTVQTNIGMQRAITHDMTFEMSYVGVRGQWFEADGLVNLDQLTEQRLNKLGLSLNNPDDISLLSRTISDPTVTARGFTLPYASFPSSSSLAQALRPYPQFNGVGVQKAMVGNYWYDSLQIKMSKRLSNGLWFLGTYTWSKDLGTVDDEWGDSVPVADSSRPPKSQKTYTAVDTPHITSVAFKYTLPTFGLAESGWKKAVFGGWTTDGILRYSSGTLIQGPNAQNGLTSVTFANANFSNRVANQPLFLHNLNKHDFNPRTTFVLNSAAWSDPAVGQYGTSKPRFSDFRNARYPNEQLGLGKVFPLKEGLTFDVRADFFNVFNRWAYPGLNGTGNALQPAQFGSNGSITNGYGYIGDSINGAASNYPPRSGQIVARIQF